MNWSEVRKANRRSSARRARRERLAAELKARILTAGGPITASEIRDAPHRVEPGAQQDHLHERHVWTIRGRDWVAGYSDGETWQAMAPFVSWRQDPDTRQAIPFTPGARKVFREILAVLFPEEVA